jgi:hypothetical protein
MPAKLPTGKKIDKPAGFPGFHPMLMPKNGLNRGISHVQALLFLAIGALKQSLC